MLHTQLVRRPIIRDDAVFSFNYVPQSLPHREKYLERLLSMFGQVIRSGMPQTAFVTGNVGTGKTVMCKRFCSELELAGQKAGRSITAEIVNCRNRSSSSAVLHHIITSRFQEHLQEKGFSVPELLNILRLKLTSNHTHLVVVLDEANALLKKEGADLVYSLSRFDEEGSGPQGCVSLILVSQTDVWELMDAAAASTFRRSNTLDLRPYSAEELSDILVERARLGLHPGTWSGNTMELIAGIAAESGDARRAIETLQAAARRSEEEGAEKILPDTIQGADASEHGGLPLERLDALEQQPLLTALAIARALRKKEFVNTGDAEKAYAVVCEELCEPRRGHTQFWKYLKILDAHGVIDTRTVREGAGGTTTMISLHDITPDRLEEMVEKIISKSSRRGMK